MDGLNKVLQDLHQMKYQRLFTYVNLRAIVMSFLDNVGLSRRRDSFIEFECMGNMEEEPITKIRQTYTQLNQNNSFSLSKTCRKERGFIKFSKEKWTWINIYTYKPHEKGMAL